jgi:competence protein ComEC
LYTFFVPFPFLRIVILWMLGICLFNYFPDFTDLFFIILILLWLFLLGFAFLKIRNFLVISFSFLLPITGYLCTSLDVADAINFDPKKADKFVFEVIDFPELKPKSIALTVQIIAFLDHDQWRKGSGKFKVYLEKSLQKPVRGSRFLAQTRLIPFPKPSFPFEKNWSEYFQSRGIYGSCYINQKAFIRLNGSIEKKDVFYYLHHLQAYLVQHVDHSMPRGINLDVAKTMLLGVKSSIDFETMAVYSSLGAIHILSVSGLHIGLLYVGLLFIFGFLKRKGPYGKILFFSIVMVLLWLYAGISGFSNPVIRSAWMFSIMLFAKAFLRQQNGVNTLAFSCFILLVGKPLALFEPGFQLSYLAVLGLIIFQNKWVSLIYTNNQKGPLRYMLKKCWELTCVALAAQIFTWPLIIYYFNQFPNPFWFLLLNPILIILSTISLGLGFVFISLAPLMDFFKLDFLMLGLGALLDFSFSVLHFVMFEFVNLFHPIISFLKIHLLEIFSYFLFIIFFCSWLIFRKLIFLSFTILLISLEIIFHLIPNKKLPLSFLSQYKGYPIFVLIAGKKSQYFGPLALKQDPLWIQGHLSPLWANFGVRDTLGNFYNQNNNYQWSYKRQKFILLNRAAIRPKELVNVLILSKKVDMKKPIWLRSWDHSDLIFGHTPNDYYLHIWPIHYPLLMKKEVGFLDQRAAEVY